MLLALLVSVLVLVLVMVSGRSEWCFLWLLGQLRVLGANSNHDKKQQRGQGGVLTVVTGNMMASTGYTIPNHYDNGCDRLTLNRRYSATVNTYGLGCNA